MQRIKHKENWIALAFCLLTFFAFFVVNTSVLRTHTLTLQMIMQVGVLAAAGGAFWIMWAYPNCNRTEVFVCLILTLGMIMRIGYMLYTPAAIRQHDVDKFSTDGVGHAGYIFWLAEDGLPDSNIGQFYHPPFYHWLAAIAVRCYKALSGIDDFQVTAEAAKTISCCASILTLIYSYKLCRYLKLSDGGMLLALSLAAFLPNHYLLAGRINNDALSVLFMTAILYYTIRWYHEQTLSQIIKLALCFGLGLMSKISVGIYAVVTGSIMLIILVRWIKNRRVFPLILQYGVFAGIAFPLGLWYPIRNYLRFDQPFTYVAPVSKSSSLFCGNNTLWQRFGLDQNWTHLYNHPRDDYNVWGYLWRGSLFGEFSFDCGTILPLLLLAANLLLIVVSLVAMVSVLRQRKSDWVVLGCFWLVQMISYLGFNLKYPFGCTMDFRYIVPTALIGALFLAKWWESLPKAPVWAAVIRNIVITITAAFSVFSIVMYCNIH